MKREKSLGRGKKRSRDQRNDTPVVSGHTPFHLFSRPILACLLVGRTGWRRGRYNPNSVPGYVCTYVYVWGILVLTTRVHGLDDFLEQQLESMCENIRAICEKNQ